MSLAPHEEVQFACLVQECRVFVTLCVYGRIVNACAVKTSLYGPDRMHKLKLFLCLEMGRQSGRYGGCQRYKMHEVWITLHKSCPCLVLLMSMAGE